MRETTIRRRFELELVEPERASRACRRVLAELEWELDNSEGSSLQATEPYWRPGCCTDMPARAELTVSPGAHGGSAIVIEGSMAGRGMIQRRRLPGRLALLEGLITAEAGREASDADSDSDSARAGRRE